MTIPPKKRHMALVGLALPVLLALQQCAYIQARVAAKEHAAMVEALQAELEVMEKEDQRVRRIYSRSDGTVKDSLRQQIIALDQRNQQKLDSIIAIHGYPGKSLVGNKLSNIGLLIVHHSPVEYMLKHHDLIIEATVQGEVNADLTAGFLDRLHELQYGMVLFYKYSHLPRDTSAYADSIRSLFEVSPINRPNH